MLAIQQKKKNVKNSSTEERAERKASAFVVSLFILLVIVRWSWYLRRWSVRFPILRCRVLGEEMELSFEFPFSKLILSLYPPNLNELLSAH